MDGGREHNGLLAILVLADQDMPTYRHEAIILLRTILASKTQFYKVPTQVRLYTETVLSFCAPNYRRRRGLPEAWFLREGRI